LYICCGEGVRRRNAIALSLLEFLITFDTIASSTSITPFRHTASDPSSPILLPQLEILSGNIVRQH
jgi:hypothetical protein